MGRFPDIEGADVALRRQYDHPLRAELIEANEVLVEPVKSKMHSTGLFILCNCFNSVNIRVRLLTCNLGRSKRKPLYS